MPNLENPDKNIDAGEMIVKRVSVPVGLEELMEGLAKEVLLNKPEDIYLFAAKYFSKLLLLRDKGNYKVKTIRSAQTVAEHNRRWSEKKFLTQDTPKTVQRQFSIRTETPKKYTATKIPQPGRENQREKPQVKKEVAEKSAAKPEQLTMEGKQKYMYSKSGYRSMSNERPKNTHHRERSQSSTDRARIVKPVTDQKKTIAGKKGKIRSLSTDGEHSPRKVDSNKPKTENTHRVNSRKASAVKPILASNSNIVKMKEGEAPSTDKDDSKEFALDIEDTKTRDEVLHTVLSQDSLEDESKSNNPSRADQAKGSETPQTLVAEIASEKSGDEDREAPVPKMESNILVESSLLSQGNNNFSSHTDANKVLAEMADDVEKTATENPNENSSQKKSSPASIDRSQSEQSCEVDRNSLSSKEDSEKQIKTKTSETNLVETDKISNENKSEESSSIKVNSEEQMEPKTSPEKPAELSNENKETEQENHDNVDHLESNSPGDFPVKISDENEREDAKDSPSIKVDPQEQLVSESFSEKPDEISIEIEENEVENQNNDVHLGTKSPDDSPSKIPDENKREDTKDSPSIKGDSLEQLEPKTYTEKPARTLNENKENEIENQKDDDHLESRLPGDSPAEIPNDNKREDGNEYSSSKDNSEEQLVSKSSTGKPAELSNENRENELKDQKNHLGPKSPSDSRDESHEKNKEKEELKTPTDSSLSNKVNSAGKDDNIPRNEVSDMTDMEGKQSITEAETAAEKEKISTATDEKSNMESRNKKSTDEVVTIEEKVFKEVQSELNATIMKESNDMNNEQNEIDSESANKDKTHSEKPAFNEELRKDSNRILSDNPSEDKDIERSSSARKNEQTNTEYAAKILDEAKPELESSKSVERSENLTNEQNSDKNLATVEGTTNNTVESGEEISNNDLKTTSSAESREEQNNSSKEVMDDKNNIATVDADNSSSSNVNPKTLKQEGDDINGTVDTEKHLLSRKTIPDTTSRNLVSVANNQNRLEKQLIDSSVEKASLKTETPNSAENSAGINQADNVSKTQENTCTQNELTLKNVDNKKEGMSNENKPEENVDLTETNKEIESEISKSNVKSRTSAFIENEKYDITDEKEDIKTSLSDTKGNVDIDNQIIKSCGENQESKTNSNSALIENTDINKTISDQNIVSTGTDENNDIVDNAEEECSNKSLTYDKEQSQNSSSKEPDQNSLGKRTINNLVEQINSALLTNTNNNKETSEATDENSKQNATSVDKPSEQKATAQENETKEKESSTTAEHNDQKTNEDQTESVDISKKKVIFYDGNGEIIIVGQHNSQKSVEKFDDEPVESIESQKEGNSSKIETENEKLTLKSVLAEETSDKIDKKKTAETDNFKADQQLTPEIDGVSNRKEQAVKLDENIKREGRSNTKSDNNNTEADKEIPESEIVETAEQQVASKLLQSEITHAQSTKTERIEEATQLSDKVSSLDNFKTAEVKGTTNMSVSEKKDNPEENLKRENKSSIISENTFEHLEVEKDKPINVETTEHKITSKMSDVEVKPQEGIKKEIIEKVNSTDQNKSELSLSKSDKAIDKNVASKLIEETATSETTLKNEENSNLTPEEINDNSKAMKVPSSSANHETTFGNIASNTSEFKESAKGNVNVDNLENKSVEKEDESDLKSVGNDSINNEDTINEVPSLTENSKSDIFAKSGSPLSIEKEDQEVAKKILGDELLKELSQKSTNSENDKTENGTESHHERKKRSTGKYEDDETTTALPESGTNEPDGSSHYNTKDETTGETKEDTKQILSNPQSIENILDDNIKNNKCSTGSGCGHAPDSKETEKGTKSEPKAKSANAHSSEKERNCQNKKLDGKQNLSSQSSINNSLELVKEELKTDSRKENLLYTSRDYCDSLEDPDNCDSNNNTKNIIKTVGTSITDTTLATGKQSSLSNHSVSKEHSVETDHVKEPSNKLVVNAQDISTKSASYDAEKTEPKTENSNQKSNEESVDMEAINATIETLKTGVINRVVKNYINNFINKEKHLNNICEQERFPLIPSKRPGSKETTTEGEIIGKETLETSHEISEKDDRQSDIKEKEEKCENTQSNEELIKKQSNDAEEVQPKSDIILSRSESTRTSPKLDKSPKTTEESNISPREPKLPNGFNLYKLNDHIGEDQNSEKQGHGTKILNKAIAVQKIQSMWRGFIVRKNINLFTSNDRSKFFYSQTSSLPSTDSKMKEMKKNVENIVQAKMDADEKQKKIYSAKSREHSPREKTNEPLSNFQTPNRPKSIESTDSAVTVIHTEEPEANQKPSNEKTQPEEDCSQLSTNIDEIDAIQNKLLDQIAGKTVGTNTKIDSLLARANLDGIRYDDDTDLDISPPADDFKEDKSGNLSPIDEQMENSKDGRISRTSTVEGRGSEGLEQKSISPKMIQSLEHLGKSKSLDIQTLSRSTDFQKISEPLSESAVQMLKDENSKKLKKEHNDDPTSVIDINLSQTPTTHLLHTGELHDMVVIPVEVSKNVNDQTTVNTEGMKKEALKQVESPKPEGLLHTGELHDMVVIPVEVLKDVNDQTTVNTEGMKKEVLKGVESPNTEGLLHTGELHDMVVIPVEVSKDVNDQTTINTEGLKKEVLKPFELPKSEGLLHTGELHDMVGLPLVALGVKTEKEKLIEEVEKNAAKLREASEELYASTGLKNTGELHDSLPQLLAINGNENGDSKEGNNSAASNSVASSTPSTTGKAAQSPIEAGLDTSNIDEKSDGSKSNVLARRSMGSRKNRLGEEHTVKPNQQEPDMEVQAATKIQAGFRGYQVRKQLKMKNGSSDMNNQRRPSRGKSSSSQNKPKEIEEKSAIKIQAGVRGFLVRRRQKKDGNQETK